jgi:hypothetical protein
MRGTLLRTTRTQPDVEPPAARYVDAGRDLGEIGGVAVLHARDELAETSALRHFGKRCHHRPRLERRLDFLARERCGK